MIRRVGAFLAATLFWAGISSAQDATGHIEGRVLAAEATPGPSVRVAASSPSLQGSRVVETDVRGYFRLRDLPVGSYQIRLALVGYRAVRFDSVAVRLGRTTSLGDTRLEAQVLELSEIVVNAQRPLIDVASSAIVTNLPSEQFTDLPTERNFRSIVTLAPLANPSQFPGEEANISGSSGPENAYYLDGVNITDPKLAATSADLPYNFVRELQVKAGGYEAEFGRATGGIIDVITHSGGNRFGGQVFGFFTNNGLTAEPRFTFEDAHQSQFSEYDVGGSLGGPILRDRLWFFAAYNPSVHRERIEVRGVQVPDDHATRHLFASKLTWRAGPRTDITLSAHGDPERHVSVNLGSGLDSAANPDAVLSLGHHGGVVLSGLVRQRLGGTAQAELGVARYSTKDNGEDAAGRTDPQFADHVSGAVSGGSGGVARDTRMRTAVHGNVAVTSGRHSMKYGVEYEDNLDDEDFDASAEPGRPQGFIDRIDETTYRWVRLRIVGLAHNRVLTAYGQDAWRVGSRLTLNYGIRWDPEFLIRPDGKLAQKFTDQWQPRVGFTYQLGELGSQKISGSYGRFYEQFPLLVALAYYQTPTSDPGRALILQYDHDPRVDPSGADTLFDSASLPTEVPPQRDLRGQSLDEFTVGYERAVGRQFRLGARGMYRSLRWAVEDARNPVTQGFEVGNPGRGNLAFAPRTRRTYAALVLTLEKPLGRHFSFLSSYVLSRSRGNYDGLSFEGAPFPNVAPAFDIPETTTNGTGRLANDRPHVFKFSGAYRFDFGLTIGTAIALMSGEPRNDLGQALTALGPYPVFLRPRGSAGRTPAVFDANLRLAYALRPWGRAALRPKVYLDLFHIGNQRTALHFEELRFEVDGDGNPTPNQFYGRPLQFQPPMSARLGMSLDFGLLD